MSKNSAFQLSGQAVLGNATNPLLVKDDVGKAKPFTHTLPSENFAFGKGSVFCESAGAGKFIYNKFKGRIPNRDRVILTYIQFSVFSYRQLPVPCGRPQG